MSLVLSQAAVHWALIVGKMVTAPLWRFVVSDVPFWKVSGIYQALPCAFATWAEDVTDPLEGKAIPFPGAGIHKDFEVQASLFSPSNCDNDADMKLWTTAFRVYMSQAWATYLNEGEHVS